MAEQTRIWRISPDSDSVFELKQARLNFEERLENWLTRDISLIDGELLIIARQEATSYGGFIDLLCLNRSGDVVIIELKRDKTPREITAQALDYASWVNELQTIEICAIANRYLKLDGSLENAFEQKFQTPLPDVLNENHQILIVASNIDAHSERIIRYLSERHGVNINAVTFAYYEHEGDEFLARNSLIEPSEVVINESRRSGNKRRSPLSLTEMEEVADERGVGDLFRQTVELFRPAFSQVTTSLTTVTFVGIMDGHRNTILNLEPFESNADEGLMFFFYRDRLLDFFALDESQIASLSTREFVADTKWREDILVLRGRFLAIDEVVSFLRIAQKNA